MVSNEDISLFFLHLNLSIYCAVAPQIRFPERSFTVNFTTPSQISIGCSATGIPEPMVEWRVADTNDIITNSAKYSVKFDVNQSSSKTVFAVISNLTIYNTITSDTRPYVCSVTSPVFTTPVETTTNVIVQGLISLWLMS